MYVVFYMYIGNKIGENRGKKKFCFVIAYALNVVMNAFYYLAVGPA